METVNYVERVSRNAMRVDTYVAATSGNVKIQIGDVIYELHPDYYTTIGGILYKDTERSLLVLQNAFCFHPTFVSELKQYEIGKTTEEFQRKLQIAIRQYLINHITEVLESYRKFQSTEFPTIWRFTKESDVDEVMKYQFHGIKYPFKIYDINNPDAPEDVVWVDMMIPQEQTRICNKIDPSLLYTAGFTSILCHARPWSEIWKE